MHVNAHLDVDVIALEQDDVVNVLLELQAPPAPPSAAPRPAHTIVAPDSPAAPFASCRARR